MPPPREGSSTGGLLGRVISLENAMHSVEKATDQNTKDIQMILRPKPIDFAGIAGMGALFLAILSGLWFLAISPIKDDISRIGQQLDRIEQYYNGHTGNLDFGQPTVGFNTVPAKR